MKPIRIALMLLVMVCIANFSNAYTTDFKCFFMNEMHRNKASGTLRIVNDTYNPIEVTFNFSEKKQFESSLKIEPHSYREYTEIVMLQYGNNF